MEDRREHSLGEHMAAPPPSFGGSACRKTLGRVGGGGSRGAPKGRCHQFQFCPGQPEAGWDFPEWKDKLGGQAAWRQGDPFLTPAGRRLQRKRWEFWGSRVGWVELPGVPTLSLICQSRSLWSPMKVSSNPRSRQQRKLLAFLSSQMKVIQGTPALFQDERGVGATWTPLPMPRTKRKPHEPPPTWLHHLSSLCSSPKEGTRGAGGVGG